jgi:hypothetical protein
MKTNAKKNMITISLFTLIPALFSCVSGSKAVGNITFGEIREREWNLMEVKKGDTAININRANVKNKIYTIIFETNRLIGAGAASFYCVPYTIGKNDTISIGRIGSTRVAPLFEMKNFTEYEYFQHLERVSRW